MKRSRATPKGKYFFYVLPQRSGAYRISWSTCVSMQSKCYFGCLIENIHAIQVNALCIDSLYHPVRFTDIVQSYTFLGKGFF